MNFTLNSYFLIYFYQSNLCFTHLDFKTLMQNFMTNFTLEKFIENKGMFGVQPYLFNLVLDMVGSHPTTRL